jgi:hypothetical protein
MSSIKVVSLRIESVDRCPSRPSSLDSSSAEMALHYDANVVRAIVGARHIKFLTGPAGSEGQDAFA